MEDWINYLILHSNNGKDRNNVQVLDPSILPTTYTNIDGRNSFIIQPPTLPNYNFGIIGGALGWVVGSYRGRKFLLANGAEAGVLTVTIVVPSERLAVSVFTNFEFAYIYYAAIGIATAAIDIALDIEPAITADKVCDWPFSLFPEPAAPPPSAPAPPTPKPVPAPLTCNPPASEYVGSYTGKAFKTFTVTSGADGLILTNALLECKATGQVGDVFDLTCELDTIKFLLGTFTGKLTFTRGDDTLVSSLLFPYWAFDGATVGGVPLPPVAFTKN